MQWGVAHFRPFRGKIRACARSQNRRGRIFYPITLFLLSNFDRLIFLNSKKTCIKFPLLGASTVPAIYVCNVSF